MLLTYSSIILQSRGVFLIDIILSSPVLLFNLCSTLTNNRRIVSYVKRVRALRMSDIVTVLKIKQQVSRIKDRRKILLVFWLFMGIICIELME